MEINAFDDPRAGEPFQFQMTGGKGTTNIQVLVNGELMLSKECDDPPCHEIVRVPRNARGATMLIMVRDTEGNVKDRLFIVADTDLSAGGLTISA